MMRSGQLRLKLATGFMCRYILEETTILEEVDAVVPVPADPLRYSQRGMSLPDDLARSNPEPVSGP